MGHPYPASAKEIGPVRAAADVGAEQLQTFDQASAVSWGAIIAGAAAAAALSLILLMLGVGLGLSSVSPWSLNGASAKTFGLSTIAWLTFTQLAASAMGGYLAGRLRTRWVAVHGDEVHFRDTAHGFLAWAIASLATAALLTSVMGTIVGGSAQAGASLAGAADTTASAGVVAGKPEADPAAMGYFIDSLFRKDTTAAGTAIGQPGAAIDAGNQPVAPASSEVGRIFAANLQNPALPADDVRHVGQLVAQRTGLSQADAEKRVTDTYTRVQANLQQARTMAMEALDKGRKAAAGASLWIFISLLVGAFVASLSATYGGRQRDL